MNILPPLHSPTYRNRADGIEPLRDPPPRSRIVPSRAVVTAVGSDPLTLIDLGEGRRIALQPFGARVWSHLADHPTLATLLERLRQDGGRPEQIAEDAAHLLAYWRQRKVIEWR